MIKIFPRILIALVGLCAQAQADIVNFEKIDQTSTLDAAAYFLSLGPYAKAETSSETGILQGSRALRVTLFQRERDQWIWVESVFFNRAGGAHVEWCASVREQDLTGVSGAIGSISSEGFSWVDASTFEFYDDEQAIDPDLGRLVEKPRRLRFRLVGEGIFEVAVVVKG